MSTPVIQKITNSKPFKIYGMFCLIRGAIVIATTTCYITFSAINENKQNKYQPGNIHNMSAQSVSYKTEPHKANPYQCPYQTHFRNESATKLC